MRTINLEVRLAPFAAAAAVLSACHQGRPVS
jgi:hypothetical protein